MKVSPRLTGKLAWYVAGFIGKTLRIQWQTSCPEYGPRGKKPAIYVLWHGRMFFPLFCMRRNGIIVLVSEHNDGEIITSTLNSAGYDTVRGSTTRGGVRALARLVRLALKGQRVAFTPDGPRGPKWKFQPGAVYVAAKSGIPIIPLTGSAAGSWFMNSWDAFQLPKPFSKGVFMIGEPYYVTGGLNPENIEKHRLAIEQRLTALTLEADRIAGVDS